MGSHWRLLSPILGKGVRSLTFLNPYAYGTQGYKGCYFFLACFSQFFSVVVFLFVHRDAKDGFLFFPIFSFPFFVDFLFACFL